MMLGVAAVGRLSAQPEFGAQSDSRASLFVQTVAFASDQLGRSRLDIYLQVPYTEISFVQQDDMYRGDIEVAAELQTENGEQVWHQNQTVELQVKEFAQTVSDHRSALRHLSTTVLPGTYRFVLQITDRDSKKNVQVNRTVHVPDFQRDSISVSDLLLANRITTEGRQRTIIPNTAGMFEEKTPDFSFYGEVYRRAPVDSVRLLVRVMDAKKEDVRSEARVQVLAGPTTQVFWTVPIDSLPAGSYVVALDVLPADPADSARVLARSVRPFSITWFDLPPTITNLDKAIAQLRYVAKGSELDYIEEAKDPAEKRKRFMEFWSKRDPDPSTPRNELMEEYYARVAYANKNFSHYMEGWKTDMGMIYIRFGAPENVERHPFELSTRPYEIWYYYQLNREFVFVDESGFGDYRLQYPTTDLWGRIR